MPQTCPISVHRVDANLVRAIAFQVLLFTLLLLLTQESIFAFILCFDFIIRTLRYSQWSPFHTIAKFVLTGWGIAPKLCDESPKRFALYLGLVGSLFLAVSYVAGFIVFATSIAMILLLCALLETLFEYCIGCKIYYAIQIIKGGITHGRNI